MLPGYTFNTPALLEEALTHRSVGGMSYERLEFLGDRLVNTLVADWLFHAFPAEPEGMLAKRHASLVRTETLAELTQELGLGEYIRMSNGEATTGGAQKASILADVFEACCAAIYLDSDFETLRAWLAPLFASRLPHIQIHDAKTQLQEMLQGENFSLPSYTVVESMGKDHEKEFTVAVTCTKGQATGQGTSKKMAEQAAAHALLQQLGVL